MDELLRARADKIAEQRAILDRAKAEGRDLTEEEAARFDALDKEIDSLTAQIERERKVREREALLDKPLDKPFRPVVPGPEPVDKKDDGGFESLAEFIAAVRWGDPRGRIRNEMRMDTPESGGYAVPEQFREELLQITAEEAVVRPRAQVIEPGDPPDAKLTIPALDHAQGVFGGVQVQWIAEGAEKPATDAKLKEVVLEPKEVAGHIVVTDRLLRNWRAANNVLRNLLRGAIAAAEDVAFLTGDGAGKPLGILNLPGAMAVNRQTAGKIEYLDIVNMLAKLPPESLSRAIWVAAHDTLPQLLQLKDEAGNLIFIRGDATRGIPDTLLGRPVRFTGRAPAAGQKGDLMLVDFQYYLIKDGSGPFIAASEHVFFRENKTVIKVFWNVDGTGWVAEPLTLENGVTRVSPYVILDVPGGS